MDKRNIAINPRQFWLIFTRNIQLSRLGMATNERLKNYIRVTMGTPDEMQVAVRILKEELAT